jgi:hypothetical protein
LYKVENGQVYMGVDSTNVASGRGRDSIRISTINTYNHGLFILDLAHMPGGACGTWPAFWMLGPDWPNNGEIDIIEGVNSMTVNAMTLHTDAGCSITNTGAFSGTLETANCDINAAGQATNAGCSIDSANSNSYGAGFNSNGGGVYATEWTSEAISIWFFPRNSIPADITSGNPDPSGWGLPQAQFTGGCDIDEHVQDQQLLFDVTFCGDWAGAVWSTDATCSSQASTCNTYVQNNPSAFTDTYWLINSLKVYTDNGASASQTTTAGSATQTATTASSASGLPTITTFVTITSSTESTPTAPVATTATSETSNTVATPTPTSIPTTFVTATAPAPTYTPTETATITTAPTWAPTTWQSSSGPWSTWDNNNGGNWGGNNWQGGNGNGHPGGNGGNGGGWGGRGSGGGWN